MIKILMFIGMGSFAGGVARYGVSRLVTALYGQPSVWGTFAANVAGCFLIGLLYGLFDRMSDIGEHWRLFLTVGFCGGFTTFSTFAHESYAGLSDGRFLATALYAGMSLIVGLAAVYFGHLLVRNA